VCCNAFAHQDPDGYKGTYLVAWGGLADAKKKDTCSILLSQWNPATKEERRTALRRPGFANTTVAIGRIDDVVLVSWHGPDKERTELESRRLGPGQEFWVHWCFVNSVAYDLAKQQITGQEPARA